MNREPLMWGRKRCETLWIHGCGCADQEGTDRWWAGLRRREGRKAKGMAEYSESPGRTWGYGSGRVRILIAVGTRDADKKEDGGFYIRHTYPKAIHAAGGIPVLYGGPIGPAEAPDVLAGMGGLLLTGGGDVEPSRFGAARHPKSGEADTLRDEIEWHLAKAALDMGVPVFGICRGIQLLACVAGGTLIQDIPSERPQALNHQGKPPRENPWHAVRLETGTVMGRRLFEAAGREMIEVNSFHHQALKELPAGFRLVARAPDGIVEAMERDGLDLETGSGFAVGVQWHPEDRWAIASPDRVLFETFVAQARLYAESARERALPRL